MQSSVHLIANKLDAATAATEYRLSDYVAGQLDSMEVATSGCRLER